MKNWLRRHTGPDLWEPLVLIAALVIMSLLVVRCHWITLWADWEFTGWVAPIANRLSDGIRLYEDQAHSPMPPLAYVLTHWIAGGHATWLTESTLIVVAQSVLVLAMYWALRRCVERPIPFIAALGSIPLYFALPKTIFYDTLVQTCVALIAVPVAALVGPARRSGGLGGTGASASGAARALAIAACGALAAVALLSKQSTAAGTIVGLCMVFAFAAGQPLRRRLADLALFLGLALAALLTLGWLISPWIDPKGLVTDVFLTGSEPKGGVTKIARNLVGYLGTVLGSVGIVVAYGVACAAALGAQRRSQRAPGEEDLAAELPRGIRLGSSLGAVAAPLVLGAAWAFGPRWLTPFAVPQLNALRVATLTSGLVIGLLATLRYLIRARDEASAEPWLPVLFLILFCSAVFHNLSTAGFRWTYDNNPLITLALAATLCGARRFGFPAGRTSGRWAPCAAGVTVCVVSCALWMAASLNIQHYRYCTEKWTEVRHLAGAKTPNRPAIRRFVNTVRALAPDARTDTVLLLPNDPNVEAWFERPRPKLSSAVIFTDQYWDRYVERDYQSLCAAPPRVIVIGPRNFWRGFQRMWNVNKGCERLIDLVQNGLLRERYVRHSVEAIKHQGRDDYLDIYVLKSPEADLAAAPGAAAGDRRVR